MVRISGLASGMDIDQMVKDLMKVERMPLDKLKQQKQKLVWQRDDYRSLNTLFFNFRTTLTNMKLTPSYRVRSAVSTNESLLSATASSGAAMSSYTISKVKQLATAASKVNTEKISNGNGKIDVKQSIMSQKDKLDGVDWKQGVVESKTLSATTDGLTSISFSLDGATVDESACMNIKVDGKTYKLVTDPNKVLSANEVRFTQSGTDGVLTFSSLKKGSSVKIDYIADKKVEKTSITEESSGFQLSHGEIVTDANFSLKINGNTYTLDANGTSLKGTVNGTQVNIGELDKATGKISFSDAFKEELKKEAEAKKASDPSLPSDESVNFEIETTYQQNYTSFSMATYTSQYPDGVSENIFIEGTDSLNRIMSKVNNSNLGVTMFYDSYTDRMTLTRSETGNFHGASSMKIATQEDVDAASKDEKGNLITPTFKKGDLIPNPKYKPENSGENDEIIFTSNPNGDFLTNVLKFEGATETGGENAYFEVNGLSTERNSNTFEMNGVNFTLKKTFDTAESVSIKNDADKVFDNIKAFVDEYNKLIDTVNKKITEERYRDYGPLTDEQREQLSDKQQEQWEEKARSGLLKGDSTLSSALSQMRISLYQPVDNANVASAFKQLAAIGITTTSNYLEGGKLEIDEAKLKEAISKDPTSVENLFRGDGTTSSSKGVIQRLYDDVTLTIDKLNDKAGKAYSTNQQFSIGRSLNDVSKRIDSFTEKLKLIENRYYRQFTAMEKAIQNSNSQMNYLLQQFSGQ